MNTNWLDYTLLTLVIIGAINWGLIGFFRFDLVAFLFGDMSWLTRIIYALVGIGGLSAQPVRKNPFCRRILITECMFRKHSVIMNYAVWIRDLSIPHNS